jgi:hypothetical protein
MRLTAISAIFLAVAGTVQAAGKIYVCVNANSVPKEVIGIAEGISSRMLGTAGVAVQWRFGESRSHDDIAADRTIIVNFEMQAPPGSDPASLSYALPYEGVHIVVFYDRIQGLSRYPNLRRTILAHVLTHEIVHMLQGIGRHSKAGVMKAHWDGRDYLDMTWRTLPFTSEDVELIRSGLQRRDTLAQSAIGGETDCDMIAAAHGRHER